MSIVITSSIHCSVLNHDCGRGRHCAMISCLLQEDLKLCMLPYMDEISLCVLTEEFLGFFLDASLNIIIVRRVLLVLVRLLRVMSKSYFIVHSCQNLTLPAMTRSRKKKNNSAMKLNLSRVHIWQRYSIHYRLSYYITLAT